MIARGQGSRNSAAADIHRHHVSAGTSVQGFRLNVERQSVREELKRRLLDHLAIAETQAPEEYALDVRSVSVDLRVSPTTLYKYGFNREINAAKKRQRGNKSTAGAAIEQDYFGNQIIALTEERDKERERSKGLVGRIAVMERSGRPIRHRIGPTTEPYVQVSRISLFTAGRTTPTGNS